MHYTLTKPYQPIALLVLLLCLPVQASADDMEALQEGQVAFNSGDYVSSFALWSTLATQGHAEAQVFVGLSYENGWGTPKNAKLAEIWYQKAASNNSASGQYLLGLRYIQGAATTRAKGLMWLQRAAANGDSSAQQFLDKGKSRGWFIGITPVAAPEMLTTPTTAPSAPIEKQADAQTVALAN
jgi:uncharacterized protein